MKIVRFKGIFYYSLHEEKTLSLSCSNTNSNKQISLKGIGKFILRSGCIAQNKELMLTSSRLQVAKFHMGGLLNRPQGNGLVNFSSSFKKLNISNGFLSYIKELNMSHIKFSQAIKKYAMFKVSKETFDRGIFDNIFRDVIMITLLIVFAVIIIIFTYYCRKYGMNACSRNEKTQKCVNVNVQKSKNVKIQKK